MLQGEHAGRTNLWPERIIPVFTGTTRRFVATTTSTHSFSDDAFFFVVRSSLRFNTSAHRQNNLTCNLTHTNKA